jgi:hypothetical protein
MGYLYGAIVVCALLTAGSLLLNLGVVRRLREHESVLSEIRMRPPATPVLAIKPGESPTPFEAVDVDGRELTHRAIAFSRVTFFTADCQACEKALPEFLARPPAQREQTIAVVVGPEPATADYVERLRSRARVVREDFGGPVSTAFGVRGFPVTVLLDEDGRAAADLGGSDAAARNALVS